MDSAPVTSAGDARKVAEKLLDVRVRPFLDLDVVTTGVREFSTCWVVGFSSRLFLETGEISYALAGGGPIIVNRKTGAARMARSALPVEDQLDSQ